MTRGPGRTDRSGETPGVRGRASRVSLIALAVVLLAGVGLRASYFGEIAQSPEFRHPLVDPLFSDYWARALVTGDWSSSGIQEVYGRLPGIPERPYFRPPGYPHFLALVYRAAGTSYVAPRIAQMVLGIGSALLALALARLLLGRAAGVVAAGFMATYWGFIYFEGELQEPSLLILLTLGLLVTLVLAAREVGRPRTPAGAGHTALLALASGLLLGLATLVRANVALFLPVALAWAFWVSRRRLQHRAFRVLALGLIVGAVIAVAPATVRNWVVARDFVPVSSNLGINLYIGNNREAQGMFVGDAPTLNRFGSCFDYPRIASELESEIGRPLRDSEVSAIYTRKAIAFARGNPAAVLRLMARKAYLFWGPHEMSLDRVVTYDRLSSQTLRLIPWTFPLALALGLAGTAALAAELRRSGRRGGQSTAPSDAEGQRLQDAELTREGIVLLAVFALTSFASFLPFFVTAGYRLPVVPVLLILGAYAAVRFATLVARRDARRAVVWPVAVAALCALGSVPLVRYEPGIAKWHYDRGVALALEGRHEAAALEYRKAIATTQNPSPETHSNLGMALAATGRLADAVAALGEAIAVNPLDQGSANNLAWILATASDESIRDGGRAVAIAERVLEGGSGDDPGFLDTLAAAYAEAGRFDDAVRTAGEALRLASGQPRLASEIRVHLEVYRTRRPFRTPEPARATAQ